MLRSRWLQALHSLGLEFWLPLPLLGLCFWVGGGLMTDQILSRFYSTANHFQANQEMEVQRSKTVISITVEIYRVQGFSRVKVKTANSALKELEYEFPVVSISQIEAAIGQELGLSPVYVKKLARYRMTE